MYRYVLILLLFGCWLSLAAQDPGEPIPEIVTTDSVVDRTQRFITRENPVKEKVFKLVDFNSPLDPVERTLPLALALDNTGSAYYSYLEDPVFRKAMDPGIYSFDLYRWTSDSLMYLTDGPSSTSLRTSQGKYPGHSRLSIQQNAFFEADFHRNFSDNIGLDLRYRSMVFGGLYRDQNVKHRNLSAGIRICPDSSRYQGLINYTVNDLTEAHNGGIPDFEILESPNARIRESVVPNLSGARMRLNDKSISIDNFYQLSGAEKIFLEQRSTYSRYVYKYFDELNGFSTNYGQFQMDPRGVRMLQEMDSWDHSLGLRTLILDSLSLFVAVEWIKNEMDLEAEKFKRSSLYLKGDLEAQLGNIYFKPQVLLGIGDNRGEYFLDLFGKYKLFSTAWNVYGRAVFLKNRPSVLANKLYVNQQIIWDNNFNDRDIQMFRAGIQNSQLPLNFSYTIQRIGHEIFYDSLQIPESRSSLLANTVSLDFKWQFGPVVSKQSVIYRIADRNISHFLPDFSIDHRLEYGGQLFRQLLSIRTGIHTRWLYGGNQDALTDQGESIVQKLSFNPIISKFYREAETILDPSHNSRFNHYQIDYYLNLKISDFSAFFRLNHIESLWWDRPVELVRNYPVYDLSWKLGIAWNFYE